MVRVCHRCHAELPAETQGSSSASDEERAMFCARCGAPQILLPSYMQTETVDSGAATTGAVPPPRPQTVEWSVVSRCAAPVGLLTALLAVAGLAAPAASFLNTLCVLGGSGVVLALYRMRRPLASVDGRIGLRIGLLTGLFMVVFMGVALAAAGVVDRFGLRGMASFDADLGRQFATFQAQMTDRMHAQDPSGEAQQRVIGYLTSPEGRAGIALFYLATLAGFVMIVTTIGGGFAGMLQTRRRALRGGNFRP